MKTKAKARPKPVDTDSRRSEIIEAIATLANSLGLTCEAVIECYDYAQTGGVSPYREQGQKEWVKRLKKAGFARDEVTPSIIHDAQRSHDEWAKRERSQTVSPTPNPDKPRSPTLLTALVVGEGFEMPSYPRHRGVVIDKNDCEVRVKFQREGASDLIEQGWSTKTLVVPTIVDFATIVQTERGTTTIELLPKHRKPGVVACIVEMLGKGSKKAPMRKEIILEELVKRFPERPEKGMRSTVSGMPSWAITEKKLALQSDGKGGYWIGK